MVNFWSMANCLNRSRNRPDLSFFCFPSEGHFRRLWKDFCRRSDPEFQNQKNPRISSAHFEASSIKKSLCGRKEVIPGELPKYFNPSTHQCRVSSREKRLEEEKKWSKSKLSNKKQLKRELFVTPRWMMFWKMTSLSNLSRVCLTLLSLWWYLICSSRL